MTPSPKPEDRLFETGCCLCGETAKETLVPRATGEHIGSVYCNACFTLYRRGQPDPESKEIDREILRRKSVPRPSAPAESIPYVPKVGDRVRIVSVVDEYQYCGYAAGQEITVHSVSAAGDDTTDKVRGCVCIHKDGISGGFWGTVEPVSAPTPSTATSEQKAASRCDFRLLNGMRCERWKGHTSPHCGRTEPKVEAQPVKADPYADHDFVNEGPTRTALANGILRNGRQAVLALSTNPLDRLAAKRAAVLVDLNTPSRTRRDRLGRKLGAFESWISTRHAK